ncbi:hypothetical protein P3G55_00355 [Leptospira sp. 96542]|nr:hypothetical protein [Leptospira sp. 96542]
MLVLQYSLGFIAVTLTFYGFIPYIRSIHKGDVKPHVFSWVIWALTTFIVFFAQWVSGGGAGALSILVSALVTCYIALVAYLKRGKINITKADWFFFLTAILSLPLWFFFSSPLYAVIILTVADILGFLPTIKKIYHDPFSENLWFYIIFMVRNIVVCFALEDKNLTTVLFPASIAVVCLFVVNLIVFRRQGVKNH